MVAQVETKDVGGWVPTRPRAPIAAMYSSPGPKYMLPTLVGQPHHDYRSVHVKKPAWPFGIRYKTSQVSVSFFTQLNWTVESQIKSKSQLLSSQPPY